MYDCYLVTEAECLLADGWWQAGAESCDPNPCPYRRVCCINGQCLVLFEEECADAGGNWYREVRTCEVDPCEGAAVEYLDWGTIKAIYN